MVAWTSKKSPLSANLNRRKQGCRESINLFLNARHDVFDFQFSNGAKGR